MTTHRLMHPNPQLRFALNKVGLAWTCSICDKLFAISPDEAIAHQSLEMPDPLRIEFQQHHCGVVLSRNFEVLQIETGAGRPAALKRKENS